MNENTMTPADVAAVVGNANRGGGTGYVYPVFPYGAGSSGNSGFGNDGWVWLIVILALLGGFRGNGFGGGYGGESGVSSDFAWLSNGQKDIMQNTNDGFNTLELGNQLNNISNGVQSLNTELCNGFAGVNQTVNAGFANAESNANARQIANMQQSFNNQLSTLQGFNQINSDLATCCCENRLATCQTQNIVQNEGNATRFADANNTRDIITNATANTQSILDKLCQLELDNKNTRIAELERQLTAADLRASQIAQTAQIRAGQETANTELLNLLNSCPIPCTPVYGRTPIFTCNNNGGCGCGNNNLF